MTTYAITLTNPGAESGSTTGWTGTGFGVNVSTTSPHSGTYRFNGNASFNQVNAGFYQIVDVDPTHHAMVDAELVQLFATGWHKATDSEDNPGYLQVTLYSGTAGGGSVLGTVTSDTHTSTSWGQVSVDIPVPSGTRSIKIYADAKNALARLGFPNSWDDFEMYFDDTPSVSVDDYQLGAYAIGQYPTQAIDSAQLGGKILGAAETSSGFLDVDAHLLGAYALVRGRPDRRDLRAWTFTQDEHDFYVIQLGDVGTLVYDRLTGQWADWRSPSYDFWRANDGVGWEGMNFACDSETGTLWRIDPTGRLDYETTPITSVITGGIPLRERRVVPCYDAELSISDAEPPTGIADGSVGISLRTSDDGGNTWYEHGEIPGNPYGDSTLIRWYGLGVMDAPGRIFEITDTGYARRIDGLNVELGNYGG